MFSKRKIAELESRLAAKEQENHKLNNELYVLKMKVADMEAVANTTPPDCIRGSWCKACEFAKAYHISNYHYGGALDVIYICGKGESCKHFVPKEN